MQQTKFNVEETQLVFLNNFKTYGFKDKNDLVRTAIEYLKNKLEFKSLESSAECYSEIYSKDDDLKELTKIAIAGWPE